MIDYVIQPFNREKASIKQLETLYSILCKYIRELDPNDIMPSKKNYIKAMKDHFPDIDIYYWLVKIKSPSKIIGWGALYLDNEKAPSYNTTKHLASINIMIEKNYRRQGIGTALLKYMLPIITGGQRTVIQGGAEHESGINFCLKLGAIEASKGHENRVYLSEIDMNLMRQWREEGASKNSETKIERFGDIPEKDIVEFCQLYTETINQQPFGEIEGRPNITPASRRESEQRVKNRDGVCVNLITREKTNEISGLTEIFYYPIDEEAQIVVHQGLTGVKEKYRNHGRAKWLKATMVEIIINEFPRAKVIITGNASKNTVMLSINNRMGFKPHVAGIGYKITTEKLMKKIAI